MHGDAKKGPLIEETTERTAGWRVAAALQGPCFLVLAEFARNPPSPTRSSGFCVLWVSISSSSALKPPLCASSRFRTAGAGSLLEAADDDADEKQSKLFFLNYSLGACIWWYSNSN